MQSTIQQPRVQVLYVSPELAQQWLGLNHVNRKIRRRTVEFFNRIMREGQFLQTGEPVQFAGYFTSGDALLVNGQHRLTAIAETGLGQHLVVVEGIARAAQDVMDTGKKRTFADVLHMQRGVEDAHSVATIVKLGWLWDKGLLPKIATGGGSEEVTHLELLAWFDRNPEVKDAQLAGRRVNKECDFSATAVGLFKLLVDRIDADQAEIFLSKLASGAELSEGDPILAARNWISGQRRERLRAMPRPVMQVAILIKTWNDWCQNTTRKQVKWNRFVEPYPEIVKPL